MWSNETEDEDTDIYSQVARIFGSSPLSSPVSSPMHLLRTPERGDLAFAAGPAPIGRLRSARAPHLELPELSPVQEVAEDLATNGNAAEGSDLPEDHAEDDEIGTDPLQEVLQLMEDQGVTWGDIVEYISDPQNNKGEARYYGFFQDPTRVKRVLGFWTSWRNSKTAKRTIHEWALQYLCICLYC